MKKIVYAVTAFCAILMLSNTYVAAMAISGPNGTSSNGWYKDSFTVEIAHGTTTCSGPGTAYQYTFTASGSTYEGSHQYTIYSDLFDNPYLSLDGKMPPTPLDSRCNNSSFNTGYTAQRTFTAAIDSMPPGVDITSPSGAITTSDSSYTISGFAGDTESGIRNLQAVDNSVAGPTAGVSGSTFSISVPLNVGTNNIQVVAYDNVGHSATSNSVTITRQSTTGGGSSGGSSGGSTSSSNPTTTSGSTSSNSTPASSNPTSSAPTTTSSANSSNSPKSTDNAQSPAVKFNQQQLININDPYGDSKASNPIDVQASADLAGATGKTYDFLLITIMVLFALCCWVIYRFRPIFTELDKHKSGLRRRIILIVTLPSIIPLLGLGFLGYQQLSNNVKSSLSGQLEKAAQTSALKLDREFNIRHTIISKTASDILQIKSQYKDQHAKLTQQNNDCQQLVKTNIPLKKYSVVTSSDSCLPFLTGFAQLTSSTSSTANDYINVINQAASQQDKDLTAQEQQRVNELLGSVRDFFPDILELDIVDASGKNIQAAIPRTDSKQATIASAFGDMLSRSTVDNLALLSTSGNTQQLILTYPITDNKQTLGGAVVALDTKEQHFMPNILQSTPKPYATDQVYFVTTNGELITSSTADGQLKKQLKPLANTSQGRVFNLKLANQTLAMRTTPLADINWTVAVGAPANSILAPLAGIQRTALLAIAGFVLLSILLGIWFVSSIAGEIERLFKGSLAFAKGNLDYRIELKSHDELQVLSETMNQMANDIKAAQTALVEKDKEFINIATHELKAPMTSIIGNLSMITEDGMGQVDSNARKLIDQAYNGTVRLREIVTDMLDIARLESGHAEFKLEPLDISTATETVVDMQSVPAQQANVILAHQPSPLVKVLADKNKLQIILTNFISNAIKYNRPGGTIHISHKINGNKLITSIQDSGLGIPLEQQSHIFEKFYRVKNADRANVPGTGLGMHITKKFIEGMGGQVWFESIHGQGTTFFFSLPISSPPPPVAPQGTPASAPPNINNTGA